MMPFLNSIKQAVRLPHKSAFDFLQRCSLAKIDMTSAISIARSPDNILDIVKNYTNSDVGYLARGLPSRGEDFFLKAGVDFFSRQGIKCSPRNISANHGILGAISEIYNIFGLRHSKSKVLLHTPTFGFYLQQCQNHEIDFELLKTRAENNFQIDPQELDEALKKFKPAILILCYPNNPTGAIMTRSSAEQLAEVIKSHEVFVISDEVFINNRLCDKKHYSIAAVNGMLERSLTLTSPTKSMGISSCKTGICAGPEWLVEKFALLGGYSLLDQLIIAEAFKNNEINQKYLSENQEKYLQNISLVKRKIEDLNQRFSSQFCKYKTFVRPYISDPDAGNVYLLDFSGLRGKKHNQKILSSGLDVAEWLLDDCKVAVVPGECSLFDSEDMLVRIALGNTYQQIERAFDFMMEQAHKIHDTPKIVSNPIAKTLKTNLNTLKP